jgi:hypothetical protein
MKVVCCYARLYPETARALRLHVPPRWLTLIDTSGSDYAYWDALKTQWTGEDDLVIIEQDIEIHGDVLASFATCREHWCSFCYFLRVGETTCPLGESLGCTRFSAELQKAVPPELIADKHHWQGLDITMGVAIRKHTRALLGPYIARLGGEMHAHVHGRINHYHKTTDMTRAY